MTVVTMPKIVMTPIRVATVVLMDKKAMMPSSLPNLFDLRPLLPYDGAALLGRHLQGTREHLTLVTVQNFINTPFSVYYTVQCTVHSGVISSTMQFTASLRTRGLGLVGSERPRTNSHSFLQQIRFSD